jgi:hypothetical protein
MEIPVVRFGLTMKDKATRSMIWLWAGMTHKNNDKFEIIADRSNCVVHCIQSFRDIALINIHRNSLDRASPSVH